MPGCSCIYNRNGQQSLGASSSDSPSGSLPMRLSLTLLTHSASSRGGMAAWNWGPVMISSTNSLSRLIPRRWQVC